MMTKTVTEAAKELRQVVLRLLDSTDPDPSLPSAARARLDTYDALLAMRDAIAAEEGTDDRKDAERWQWIRRKLCLTGNGDGTCAMDALNLPVRIEGWPEPGEENVKTFCDAAIDAAIAKERTS